MDRSRNILTNFFLAFAVCGLAVNLTLDLLAFQENRVSDQTGEKIHNTIALVMHLQEEASLDREQSTLLKNLSTLIKEDHRQNATVDSQMLWTLGFDIFLIAILAALFLLNAKEKKVVENTLKSSLTNMRHALASLEEQAIRKNISTKSVIHDLKNPIGAILGFAQLMNDDPHTASTVSDFSTRIKQISERSLSLVESLLAPEIQTPMTELIDLKKLLTNLLLLSEFQIEEKKQRIITHFESNLVVKGNELKLEELMTNIISNAIKYSPLSSEISVTLKRSKKVAEISVKDSGPGFSEADKKLAFGFGQKLTAQPTNAESSSGYGLFIARHITEMHEGSIEILSNKATPGATLIVRLPLYDKTMSSDAVI